MTIIYLEDDIFFAEGVKRSLATSGIQVRHTTKPERVFELVAEEAPHVILLEVRASGEQGFEFLKRLQATPATASVPVMIWTNLAAREDIERCRALGVCAYFLKGQHQPQDVALHLRRRLSVSNGFTVSEWLVALAGLLLAITFAALQVERASALRRDDAQLQQARAAVSTIVAAQHEQALLIGCADGDPLARCRICKDESCRYPLPIPWDKSRTTSEGPPCSALARRPCALSIERESERPLSTAAFRLRFYLARERTGLEGGRTHTMNVEGVVE